ncbi:hypothetical protein [Staphylococcus kloosii]|uniref:Gram-positive cocci surface proteins LPxTG domain-containing protein n=1 Tax=Staphylococcus kloosii TaxID=29384 RepID=A0A151A2M4_9STAP|nr:hypothetical protein [Staphylococcus kloosii]KYH13678.1 hypothetical protein A0131_02500 [Staphylococcus kloosii]
MLKKSIIASLSTSTLLFTATQVNAEEQNKKLDKSDSSIVTKDKIEDTKESTNYFSDWFADSSVDTTILNNDNSLSEDDKLLLQDLYGDDNASPFDKLEEPNPDESIEGQKDGNQLGTKVLKWNKLKQYQYEIPTSTDKDYNQLVKEGKLKIDYDKYNEFLAENYPEDYVPVLPNGHIDNLKFEDYLMYIGELERSFTNKSEEVEQNHPNKLETRKPIESDVKTFVEKPQTSTNRLEDKDNKVGEKSSQQKLSSDKVQERLDSGDNIALSQQKVVHKENAENKDKKDLLVKNNVSDKKSKKNLDEVANKSFEEKAINNEVASIKEINQMTNKDKINEKQNVKSNQSKVKQLPKAGNEQSNDLFSMSILVIGLTLVSYRFLKKRYE